MTDLATLPWADHSPELDKWATAYVEAWAELEEITKGRKAEVEMKQGGKYSYTFANIADVLASIRPVLAKHGLAPSQPVAARGSSIAVWTTLFHTSGQYVTFVALEMAGGNTPQSAGSAITYARRYALGAAMGLAMDDDDGAAATDAVKRQNERPAQPQAPQEPQFITARQVDAANKRYAEDGASTEDVTDWVMEATNGRTARLEEVYGSELVGLRDARQAWLNRSAAPTELPLEPERTP